MVCASSRHIRGGAAACTVCSATDVCSTCWGLKIKGGRLMFASKKLISEPCTFVRSFSRFNL